MNDAASLHASDCIESLRLSVSPSEFGYKVQALAAHVLLRLGYRVEAINRTGHPDIVAIGGTDELLFEIEAEVLGPRPRQLTDEDLASLIDSPGVEGYFGLAISFPTPRWVLVPASRLIGRKPSHNVLLEALSDKGFSDAWTTEYVSLLNSECRRIVRASFSYLCDRALEGRSL